MKKTITIFLSIVATTWFLACVHDPVNDLDQYLRRQLSQVSGTGSHLGFLLPESDNYAALPHQDAKNPVTKAKADLGKMLFFEPGLGVEAKYSVSKVSYSCSSCHVPERGFTAGRFQGIADGAFGFGRMGDGRSKLPNYHGDEVDAQGARPLPVINTTFVTNALWAGTFGSFGVNKGTEAVWNQDTLVEINYKGLEGLEANNARALIVHRQLVNKAITDSLGYTALFDAAFPDIPVAARYTRLTAAFAIAAYFRTILTNEAPFQRWLKDDADAMTEEQKRGAILFFGKAGCVRCHNSPSLNKDPHQFFALGVKDLYQSGHKVFRTGPEDKRNLGRGGFTGLKEDMFEFKVPQLYNLKEVGFYFHGASKRSLREVVEYFNAGVPENPNVPASQISPYFHPLGLTEMEVDDLTAFLTEGLYDPNLKRYAPSRIMSGFCFPNNDPLSRIEQGCK